VNGGWSPDWREGLPGLLAREWDLLIVGGGITGAGILLEASRRGLKALLLEQRDFAWGTSSRSSKLVHGGLRYLKQGAFGLTLESVREREALLAQAPGLVEEQGFAVADYAGRPPGRRLFMAGLAVYDWMAGRRRRRYVDADTFAALVPRAATAGLRGGMLYADACTDDARLVLRVLQEAQRHGGVAVNYAAARALRRASEGGPVAGAEVFDELTEDVFEVRARVVVNATGAWADGLRGLLAPGRQAAPRLRPLRGSHLLLPAWRLPLVQAVGFMHPRDGRPVFVYPWEGAILAGTTDLDHGGDIHAEARISRAELEYLLEALRAQFPSLDLGEADIISTYAGVRPVIAHGHANTAPSGEGREHALWLEDGLLTVTGGKLTTFRPTAIKVLKMAAPLLPHWRASLAPLPLFAAAPPLSFLMNGGARLRPAQLRRLTGRYGAQTQALLDAARLGELETIAGSETLWAQVRWAARAEAVLQLDDLLLRRTRLGLQLPRGAVDILPRVRLICQQELQWDEARCDAEEAAWLALWASHHAVPPAPGSGSGDGDADA
jgi:glycerol-3-phosphate dehydrogenase